MAHEVYHNAKAKRIFFVVSKSLIFFAFVVFFFVIAFASVVYLHLNRNSISDVLSEYNSEESLLLNTVSSLYLSDQASSAVKEIIGDSSKESSLNIIEIED